MGRKANDLTGKRFGRLTVLKRVENYIWPNLKTSVPQWLCRCDCGNYKKAVGTLLVNGTTKSCGCLITEHNQNDLPKINSIKNKQYNRYDLSGEYGIGYTNKGEEFYFDLEDYEKIKDICWSINKDGYVIGSDKNNKTANARMHRIVMDVSDPKIYIDHINGKNKHDNRKQNLRIVTPQQNNFNRIKQINNTSGTTGVSWSSSNSKWRAYIKIDRKNINLGYYIDINEAIEARKKAEIKYFGEYRYRGEKI